MEQMTNIRLILDKVLRHPLMQDLSFETAIDYAVDFMRIVGCPTMFEEKVVILDIEDYRAMLPCDYYTTIQVRDYNTKTCYTSSTDSFHMSHNPIEGDFTYKIQGNIIYSSQKDGKLEFSYRAIAVDDEGYPTLPDNSSYTRALAAYIKKEWFTILFDMNKISPQVLQQALQDYAWAVGDCQTEFNRLNIDKANSVSNAWKRFIIREEEHSSGFRFENRNQKLKVH